MTITSIELKTLNTGDCVAVYRNFDHPAWDNQNVEDFIDVFRVLDATADEVYLSNRFWYRRETGLQRQCDATYIKEIFHG